MTTAIPVHLPVLQEWHTSDLTASCMRSVYHRHRGELDATMTTALYRGLVAGAALEYLHTTGLDITRCPQAVLVGARKIQQLAHNEHRPLSDAVATNQHTIHAEVLKVLEYYCGRFADSFGRCRVIGCELPIRCDIQVDGESIHFASHLDLLFRQPDGTLVVWDWKWRDESPTNQYLSRNLQLAMYGYAVRYGQVQLTDGDWVSFGVWPAIAWIHLPNLKPYARNGANHKAGEHRHIDHIVRSVPFHDGSEHAIVHEFAQRVRMARAGFWPQNPDPVGCHLCESAKHCTQFTGVSNENI